MLLFTNHLAGSGPGTLGCEVGECEVGREGGVQLGTWGVMWKMKKGEGREREGGDRQTARGAAEGDRN